MSNSASHHHLRRGCACVDCSGGPSWMTPPERLAWQWEQGLTDEDRAEQAAFAAMGY